MRCFLNRLDPRGGEDWSSSTAKFRVLHHAQGPSRDLHGDFTSFLLRLGAGHLPDDVAASLMSRPSQEHLPG